MKTFQLWTRKVIECSMAHHSRSLEDSCIESNVGSQSQLKRFQKNHSYDILAKNMPAFSFCTINVPEAKLKSNDSGRRNLKIV